MKSFRQIKEGYLAYKESKGMEPTMTKKEALRLYEGYQKMLSEKQTLNESTKNGEELNDIAVVIANYKKVKEARLGTSKVTYKEVKKLREAVEDANKKGVRMIEADQNFAAGATDPNAAPAADPNADPNAAAGGAVSPDVQSQIQALLQQVQTLATAAGVQLNDFGGDPNADMPPVDGTQPQTADAAAPAADTPQAPMMEAVAAIRKNGQKCDEAAFTKIKAELGQKFVESIGSTKDRIAMRSAKLECMNESFTGDFAGAYFTAVGLKEAISPTEGIPSEKEVAKGTCDAKGGLAKELKTPVAWPDHQISTAPLQGEGAKQQKVKESSASPVTDKYVENFFGEKLSFEAIRESMKTGLLG